MVRCIEKSDVVTVQHFLILCLFCSKELCGIRLGDVLVTVEQVLCLYQELNPALLTDHAIILGKYC